ncbi:unnamed protein product [Heligmosomoides polygyrus]|uniref:Uncharacterized protein n=1 Tax=Heligmosomoides polygyrus TaxID=6339 RepID=A0A183GLC0_HELPZ|nr:unnamed protein product [Heligmosomoides polygyrus]
MFILKRVSELFKKKANSPQAMELTSYPQVSKYRAKGPRSSFSCESDWDERAVSILSVDTDPAGGFQTGSMPADDRKSRPVREDMEAFCCESKARRGQTQLG